MDDLNNKTDEINKLYILSESIGGTYIQRLSHIYGKLWEKKYGMKPIIAYGQIGKVAKEYLDLGFNEYQIAYLIILFFDWSGASGEDDFQRKRLIDKTHSIFLMKPIVDSIRAYSKNVLKIDVDNTEQIKPIVDRFINN